MFGMQKLKSPVAPVISTLNFTNTFLYTIMYLSNIFYDKRAGGVEFWM